MKLDRICKPFDYTTPIQSYWPPSGTPQPPFGPTAIDVMRSCPLRSVFDFSPGYERRVGVAARTGIAMHKTLQSLSEIPILGNDTEIIAMEAKNRFNIELNIQKSQAAEQPRETHLEWDSVRIYRAMEAVIAEAIRTHGTFSNHRITASLTIEYGDQGNIYTINREHIQAPITLPAYEVTVCSKDNLFRGRIDRAEQIPEGTRLVDYKSAYRDDLPDRYIRQMQMYAYLWFETTGEWPVIGQVFYPLKGTFFEIPVTKDTCLQVVAEAVALIHQLEENKRPDEVSTPGDVCKVCDYRPWCRPFWTWQASEKILIKAKEKASIGFEGQVENINLVDNYWRLVISWRGIKVRLVTPKERFSHLVAAKPGQLLRFLDAPLKGVINQPSVQVFDTSEIYLVM